MWCSVQAGRQLMALFFFIIFIFFPFADSCRADELAAFLKKVEEKAVTVTSFSCAFKQERHLSIFSKPVLFYGNLTIVRPDRLRWEFNKPLGSVLVLDGSQGLRCSGNSKPQKFDITGNPVMRIVFRQLWAWMNGEYSRMREAYDISLLSDKTGIVLHPLEKAMASVVSTIIILFDSTTLQPVNVEIHESSGDKTLLQFSDYILNPSVNRALFTQCSSQ